VYFSYSAVDLTARKGMGKYAEGGEYNTRPKGCRYPAGFSISCVSFLISAEDIIMSVRIFRIVLPIVLVMFIAADSIVRADDQLQEPAQRTQQITALIEAGSYQQAEADTAVLIADFDGDAELPACLYDIAKVFTRHKQLETAQELCETIVSDYPDSDVSQRADIFKERLHIEQLINDGNPAGAQAATDSLIADFSDNPDLPDSLYKIVKTFEHQKKYEKAQQLCERLIIHYPDSDVSRRAAIYKEELHIEQLINDDDLAGAQKAADSLIEDFNDNPDLADTLYKIARKFRSKLDYAEGAKYFEKITKLFPDSKAADKARLDISVMEITSAIGEPGADPNGAVTEPNATDAIKTLTAEPGTHPELAEGLYRLARRYDGSKYYQQAKQVYQYIVDNYPGSSGAKWAVIDIPRIDIIKLVLDARFADANDAFDDFVAEFRWHPSFAEAVTEIQEAYIDRIMADPEWTRNNYLQPIAMWEKAVEQCPGFSFNQPHPYYYIACCYYQLEKYVSAAQYFDIVLRRWPEHRLSFGARQLMNKCIKKLEDGEQQ